MKTTRLELQSTHHTNQSPKAVILLQRYRPARSVSLTVWRTIFWAVASVRVSKDYWSSQFSADRKRWTWKVNHQTRWSHSKYVIHYLVPPWYQLVVSHTKRRYHFPTPGRATWVWVIVGIEVGIYQVVSSTKIYKMRKQSIHQRNCHLPWMWVEVAQKKYQKRKKKHSH